MRSNNLTIAKSENPKAVLRLRETQEGYPMLNWRWDGSLYRERTLFLNPEETPDVRKAGTTAIEDIPQELSWMIDELRRAIQEGAIVQKRKQWKISDDLEGVCTDIENHPDEKVAYIFEETEKEIGGDAATVRECPKCGDWV